MLLLRLLISLEMLVTRLTRPLLTLKLLHLLLGCNLLFLLLMINWNRHLLQIGSFILKLAFTFIRRNTVWSLLTLLALLLLFNLNCCVSWICKWIICMHVRNTLLYLLWPISNLLVHILFEHSLFTDNLILATLGGAIIIVWRGSWSYILHKIILLSSRHLLLIIIVIVSNARRVIDVVVQSLGTLTHNIGIFINRWWHYSLLSTYIGISPCFLCNKSIFEVVIGLLHNYLFIVPDIYAIIFMLNWEVVLRESHGRYGGAWLLFMHKWRQSIPVIGIT